MWDWVAGRPTSSPTKGPAAHAGVTSAEPAVGASSCRGPVSRGRAAAGAPAGLGTWDSAPDAHSVRQAADTGRPERAPCPRGRRVEGKVIREAAAAGSTPSTPSSRLCRLLRGAVRRRLAYGGGRHGRPTVPAEGAGGVRLDLLGGLMGRADGRMVRFLLSPTAAAAVRRAPPCFFACRDWPGGASDRKSHRRSRSPDNRQSYQVGCRQPWRGRRPTHVVRDGPDAPFLTCVHRGTRAVLSGVSMS